MGFSNYRRSTGVVIIDRATRMPAHGTTPVVTDGPGAVAAVVDATDRLQPSSTIVCVDGPFVGPHARPPATQPPSSRLIERFFSSGPFAAVPPSGRRLRLMPAPTRDGSRLLDATRAIVARLGKLELQEQCIVDGKVCGQVIEIFPSLFMGAMLPPRTYTGKRKDHSDDLWCRLFRVREYAGTKSKVPSPLDRYRELCGVVEAGRAADRHDLRTAAISAIAADLYAAARPGSHDSDAVTFIGTPDELGFILPPIRCWNPGFRRLVNDHWRAWSREKLLWL